MPDVIITIPIVTELDGFGHPNYFYDLLPSLLEVSTKSGWSKTLGEGGYHGARDQHWVYGIHNINRQEIDALRPLLAMVRCVLAQNSIYMTVDGRAEYINRN